MAQFDKNKFLRGAIGNLVFRNLDGKQIVQSKSDTIKQSPLTILSGSEFRKCSQWARLVRQNLYSFLNKQTDSYMYRRLTGSLYKALLNNTSLFKGERTPLNCNLDGLVGFDFNSNSPFDAYFFPKLNAVLNEQRQVVLSIDAFNPKKEMVFPQRTSKAELLIYVFATNLEYHTGIVDDFLLLPIEQNNGTIEATSWTSAVMPEHNFVLIVAKVMYYTTDKFIVKNYINTKECSPAVLVMAKHT